MICHIGSCSSQDVVLFCPECGMATCKYHVAANPDPSMRPMKPTICTDCASSRSAQMAHEAELAQQQQQARIAAYQREAEQRAINEKVEAENRQRQEEQRLYDYNNIANWTIQENCPECQGRGEVDSGFMTFLTGYRTCPTCNGEKIIERLGTHAEFDQVQREAADRRTRGYSSMKDKANSGISDMSDRW